MPLDTTQDDSVDGASQHDLEPARGDVLGPMCANDTVRKLESDLRASVWREYDAAEPQHPILPVVEARLGNGILPRTCMILSLRTAGPSRGNYAIADAVRVTSSPPNAPHTNTGALPTPACY